MPFSILATGFVAGLALIVAIGAQNAYVLRIGLSAKTGTVTAVVLVCAVSDTALIAAGIAGIGVLTELAPPVLVVLRLAAIVFLLVYGALSLRRALRSPETLEAANASPPRLWPAVLTVLAFTWLNPHVYLDTVLFLGSIGNQFGDQRWWFWLGAAAGSWAWFLALGFGARALRPLFAKPWTWRVLDALIALIMLVLATVLIVELVHGA